MQGRFHVRHKLRSLNYGPRYLGIAHSVWRDE